MCSQSHLINDTKCNKIYVTYDTDIDNDNNHYELQNFI